MKVQKWVRVVAAAAGGLGVVGMAHADSSLPTGVATMFTAISANATEVFGLAWPVATVIIGGFVVFKLVKRAVGKL